MRIAVTGATGHVGGALIRLLLEKGHRVQALIYQDGPALDGLEVERFAGNVLDQASLEKAFKEAEAVFHLASMITLGRDRNGLAHRINVDGVQHVIQACRACRVQRLVHFSSIHALSPYPLDAPVTEENPLAEAPHLPAYDRTKAAGEMRLMAAGKEGFDAVTVNPTGIIGPLDFELSRMGRVFLDLYHQKMPALTPGGFNWVDVRDVAKSALAALEKGRCGERYLLGGHYKTIGEVATTAKAVTGRPVPRLMVPMAVARSAAPFAEVFGAITKKEPRFTRASLHAVRHHQQVNCSKASKELDHSPRPFETSVQDIYHFFQEAGRL